MGFYSFRHALTPFCLDWIILKSKDSRHREIERWYRGIFIFGVNIARWRTS